MIGDLYFMSNQITISKKTAMQIHSALMNEKKQKIPQRSRSRSRSKTPKRKVHMNNNGRPVGKKVPGHVIKTHVCKVLTPIVKNVDNSTKKLALAKGGYFDSKDSKIDLSALSKDVDQLTKEMQLAVAALRAGLGDRPIRMRLSATFVITTTVTSGVTNTVTLSGGSNLLEPVRCNEWTTMAALFEEYKCLGGEFVFNYKNSISSIITAGIGANSVPVIAYDADNSTAASSSVELTQAAQHKTLEVLVVDATNNYGFGPASAAHHRFRWHVPKGTSFSSPSVSVPGTEWIPVAAVQSHGVGKFYHVGNVVTAIDTGAGFVYFDLEFRCRA